MSLLAPLRACPRGFTSLLSRAFHAETKRDGKAPFPGVQSEFTNEMRFIMPDEVPTIPIYRVLNQQG